MARVRVMHRNKAGEMEDVSIAPQIMTQEVADLIGAQAAPVIMEIERGAIRRYAQALEDPNPLYGDAEYARQSKHGEVICPPGFFGWPVKASSEQVSLLGQVMKKSNRMNTMDNGGELEFMLPVRAGDMLVAVARIADIYEEVGRSGNHLLLVLIETTYLNQNGDKVARSLRRQVCL